MTTQEFSNSFDTLLNSYSTQAQFGDQTSRADIVLDEYEKSVLLTQAQDIIVKSYFDGTLNQQGQGFDDSTRRQVDFSSLITVESKEKTVLNEEDNKGCFDKRGIFFDLPDKALFILNERFIHTIAERDKPTIVNEYVVVPISYKEYDREMSKAYAQPLKKQVWRLFQNQATGYDVKSEIIPNVNLGFENSTASKVQRLEYRIRFVRRPKPIILENLPDGLKIDEESNEMGCELNPIIHVDILNKAVELALSTRGRAPQQQSN